MVARPLHRKRCLSRSRRSRSKTALRSTPASQETDIDFDWLERWGVVGEFSGTHLRSGTPARSAFTGFTWPAKLFWAAVPDPTRARPPARARDTTPSCQVMRPPRLAFRQRRCVRPLRQPQAPRRRPSRSRRPRACRVRRRSPCCPHRRAAAAARRACRHRQGADPWSARRAHRACCRVAGAAARSRA